MVISSKSEEQPQNKMNGSKVKNLELGATNVAFSDPTVARKQECHAGLVAEQSLEWSND